MSLIILSLEDYNKLLADVKKLKAEVRSIKKVVDVNPKKKEE